MIGCSKSEKIFILILLFSFLIFSIGQSHGEERNLTADSQVSNIAGLIKHIWLDHPIIPPEAFNHPPDKPSKPMGPTSGMPSTAYSYSLYADDFDGDQLSYSVDWGDETTSKREGVNQGTSMVLNHSWTKAGAYQVRSTVTDSHGSSSQWSDPLIVIINSPPNTPAMPKGQTSGKPGRFYSFSTSANDTDGDPLKYTIDWGDGSRSISACTESGGAENLLHSWSRAGVYQVKASAADCRGASSQWSEPLIVIINTPPDSPSPPEGPKSGYANAPYRFNTSATDPDQDPLIYTFDWGDGDENKSELVGSGINTSSTHTWKSPGSYCIRVSARDSVGSPANSSGRAYINIAENDRPDMPRDLYGLRSGYTGISYTYFTMAKDLDGDHVRYILDWGDGNTSATDYVKSGSLENASHKWSRAGKYSVKASAVDGRGAPSDWSGPFLITVDPNDPPDTPIVPSGPTAGQCQWTYEYETSSKDPDGDLVKYVFDWGDGTTSWTGLDFVNSGEEMKSYHKWINPGIFQIKAAAIDDKGTISGWSMTLAVKIVKESDGGL